MLLMCMYQSFLSWTFFILNGCSWLHVFKIKCSFVSEFLVLGDTKYNLLMDISPDPLFKLISYFLHLNIVIKYEHWVFLPFIWALMPFLTNVVIIVLLFKGLGIFNASLKANQGVIVEVHLSVVFESFCCLVVICLKLAVDPSMSSLGGTNLLFTCLSKLHFITFPKCSRLLKRH